MTPSSGHCVSKFPLRQRMSSRWDGAPSARRMSGDGDSAPESGGVGLGSAAKSNGTVGSPSASSTASDSPTPTNSVQHPWYSANWQSLGKKISAFYLFAQRIRGMLKLLVHFRYS